MRQVDPRSVEVSVDVGDPEGYRARTCQLGPLLGAAKLGATVFELDPGDASCPYHYELGNEEWLLVLDGIVAVRHPGGEELLAAGRLACFPDGRDGAHKVRNPGPGAARFLMLSTKIRPAGWGYPDSDKIAISAVTESGMFRRASAVDYWDGEAGDGVRA